MKFVKIFMNADDHNVVARKVYVKTGLAYSDAAMTIQIDEADLHDIFVKGAIIVDTAIEYSPVSYKEAAGVGTITYVKTD